VSDQPTPPPAENRTLPVQEPGLDAAQQSLSDALSVSFLVLKVLMVVIVSAYVFIGSTFQVNEQNKAVRLRFGERVGGIYEPGWHFKLPFPLEQVVPIPSNVQNVKIDNAFWYDNPEGLEPERLANRPLDPLKDGFLITSDKSVVHIQFEVGFVITNEDKFVIHVGDMERAEEIVTMAAERGMVHAVSSTSASDIVFLRNRDDLSRAVMRHTQAVLGDLDTGIEVRSIKLSSEASMPVQVRQAYLQVTQARSDKATMIQTAQQQANGLLGESAGAAHNTLSAMIIAYELLLEAGDDALAQSLRAEIDASLHALYLPGDGFGDKVEAYNRAIAATSGSDAVEGQRAQARAEMAQALSAIQSDPDYLRSGVRVEGNAANAIKQAFAYQSEVIAEIEAEYNRYAGLLQGYRENPSLVAADLWQTSRKDALADAMIETVIASMDHGQLWIDTDPDPQVREEIAQHNVARAREEAARLEAEQNGR